MDSQTLVKQAFNTLARLAQENTPLDGTTIYAIADCIGEGMTIEAAYSHVTSTPEGHYEVKWMDLNPAEPREKTAIRGGDRYRSIIRGILDNPQFRLISVRRLEK